MDKKPHDKADQPARQPDTEERDKLDRAAREAESHLHRAEASLRKPEDRRATARKTTPAGKGRSQ